MRQCTGLSMSEVPHLPDGDTPSVDTGGRALSPQTGILLGCGDHPGDRVRQQRPRRSAVEEGERPPSGRTVSRTCPSATGHPCSRQCSPHGLPTAILAQLLRDGFLRLSITALMKEPGIGKTSNVPGEGTGSTNPGPRGGGT